MARDRGLNGAYATRATPTAWDDEPVGSQSWTSSTAEVKLSNTDRRAVEFIDQLAAAKRLFPIVSAVNELSGRALESASAGSP